jgi:molybdenum cofactor cytidylyltransferase
MEDPVICAIVLAAGRSKRMGAQKLLLPFAGRTVIEHIIDEVTASSVGQTIVVTGADGASVSGALAGRRLVFVSNPEFDSEMLESIRCGLAALPEKCEAMLIVLGDQPAVRREWIDQLVSTYRSDGGTKIIVPLFDGHRGHPMLIPTRFREELQKHHDTDGVRGLLDAHASDVIKLPWQDDTVLADMDFPDDYQRELDRERERSNSR